MDYKRSLAFSEVLCISKDDEESSKNITDKFTRIDIFRDFYLECLQTFSELHRNDKELNEILLQIIKLCNLQDKNLNIILVNSEISYLCFDFQRDNDYARVFLLCDPLFVDYYIKFSRKNGFTKHFVRS